MHIESDVTPGTTRATSAAREDDFDAFVRARSDALYRTAVLLCGDRHLAEDLVQTALAQAWRHWDRVTTSHEGFVRRTLVNTYLSWWRRKWTGERPTEHIPEHASSATDTDQGMDLWVAVQRLPRRQRAVVVLRYYEDLPDQEIATILGCANGTVRSQAHRALAALSGDSGLVHDLEEGR